MFKNKSVAIIGGFGAMYLIWGTTFLAIRYGLDSFPPFLMAGVRFLIAGSLFVLATPHQYRVRLTRAEWRGTALLGVLMITAANGLVTWAEQRVSSGMTALLWATFPLWLVTLERLIGAGSGTRVRPLTLIGTVIGFGGAALLFLPGDASMTIDPIGALVITVAVLAWTMATLVSPRARQPESHLYASGIQMLLGGSVLMVIAALGGDAGRLDLAAITLPSVLGFGYLVIFGSLVFPLYLWLLKMTSAATVATEAYVCPIIALVVGIAVRGEPMSGTVLASAAIVLVGVALMVTDRGQRRATFKSCQRPHMTRELKIEGGM